MKRLVIVLIIVLVMISGCSYNSDKKTDSEKENLYTETDGASVKITLSNMNFTITDVFTGIVKSQEQLDNSVEFEGIDLSTAKKDVNAKFILYNVEVQKNIWSLTATENSIIKVVHIVSKNDDGFWSDELEIGKTYLVGGIVEQYKDSAVIFDFLNMTSLIEGDALKPVTSNAKKTLDKIETLSAFEQNEDIVQLKKTKHDYIPRHLYDAFDDIELQSDKAYNYISDDPVVAQTIIDRLKEAIKVDSKVKMDISYDNYPNDDTK